MATTKQKTKMKKTAFAVAMVAGMAFGGIMVEKAYSRYYPNPALHNPQPAPAPAVKGRIQTIKDQLDPRKWDTHKRMRTGLAIGMFIGALFLLVKNIRETEMELKAEREKNKPSSQ